MLGTFGVPLLLIALNALFVLVEYALLRVRSSRIEVLARRGNAQALSVQHIQAHLDEYLAAIQVGITLIALALGAIGEPAVTTWVGRALSGAALALPIGAVRSVSFVLALAVLTWAQVVFGELLPRGVGIHKAESIALWAATPLRLFAAAFRMPVRLMSFCSVSLLKLLGFKPAAQYESAVSEEELRVLLGQNQQSGALPLERLLLLENLFDFAAAKAAEAMAPREKIAFLSLKKSWEENLAVIRARRFSRYPLCEDGLDSVVGMIHVKDMILGGDGAAAPDLRRSRRDIASVLEADPLEKLLKYFPDKGIHMALVRDALGRVSGLLTLEDIVEELIGEVHDEFDLPQAWSLMDVVVSSAVTIQLEASDRREAIAKMLAGLAAAQPDLKEQEAFQVVWERELKFSSAVGRGVAVPHGRLANLSRPMVAVARLSKPLLFPAPDNAPVRLIFLILTPASSPVIQLKVLRRIASLVINENLRRRLLRAETAGSMLETLRTADTLLAV